MTTETNEMLFYARKLAQLQIWCGVGLLVLSVVMMMSSPVVVGGPIGIAVVMIGVGWWRYATPVLRVGDDYFALRLAPLRSEKTVLNSEIINIEQKNKKYIVHYQPHDENSPRKVTIVANMLTSEDYDETLELISNKVATANS